MKTHWNSKILAPKISMTYSHTMTKPQDEDGLDESINKVLNAGSYEDKAKCLMRKVK